MINAEFARRHFGRESPLGRRFRTAAPNGTNAGPWRKIVGVVSQVRMQGPFNNQADGSGFYVPYFAPAFGPANPTPVAQQFGTVIVRPRGGQRPESLIPAVQAVVKQVDPNLPIYFPGTPKDAIEGFLAQNRIVASMFAVFGAIAVILASVGLYGVTSFAVNQRTQEFGVRMALGADPQRILHLVLGQAGWQLLLGLLLGLGATFGIATAFEADIQNQLFLISPRDPVTYAAVTVLLVVVCLIATLVPARRATRVDPMIALRTE